MATPETEETLLELLRANTDEWGWLQPLLDDPESGVVVRATIAQMARLGAAIVHNRDALLISACSAGQPGTCLLTLTRVADGSQGTIPAGYPFVDLRGVVVRLQADVVVPLAAFSIVVPAVTDRKTELVNSEDDPGFRVHPDAPWIIATASISSLIAPAGAAANNLSTLHVGSSSPVTGGAADYLTAHGDERGARRQTGETEAEYRARIRNVPDAVAPLAMSEVVHGASQRAGLPGFLIGEPFDDLATPAVKEAAGLYAMTSVVATRFEPGGAGDFMDDELTPMLDRREATAYFEVLAGDYVTDRVARAMFMDSEFSDDPIMGFTDAWLTLPQDVLAGLTSLHQQVSATKAAGVNFDVFGRRPTALQPQGTTISATEADAWTLPAPAGTAWVVVSGTVGFSSPNPVPGAACRLRFVAWDGEVIDTVLRSEGDTRYVDKVPGKPITVIRGRGKSDGSTALDVVGTILVHRLEQWPP